MNQSRLIFRNLIYYWRTNLPIIAGVAAAVAVLSGALLVGQSVRGSLRQLLYERIGKTEYLITAENYFSEKLAAAFPEKNESCPIIFLKGMVIHEESALRAHAVNVYGVDERFWKFHTGTDRKFPDDRSSWVGVSLARQLNIQAGDSLLLTVEQPQAIPKEWLYGRRENAGKTLRLHCDSILQQDQLGEFSLKPVQGNILSIFVPLKRLQRDLAQPSRVNAILLSGNHSTLGLDSIQDSIKKQCTLEDAGLKLRMLPSGSGFLLESRRIILDNSIAQAAMQAATGLGLQTSGIYTYLANSIRTKDREIPYSAITAADLGTGALASIQTVASPSVPSPPMTHNESIWLTDWALRDLRVVKGEPVEVEYYSWLEDGKMVTRSSSFRVAGVVAISGEVNSLLSPEIPGITEARSLHDWDPPFPLDLGRIRKEDEDFWDLHRATPKAFISLSKGQELWQSRFGKLTALRVMIPNPANMESSQANFSKALLDRLSAQQVGFTATPVKELGLAASQGATDFGEYFLYFSFFLIVAAILLAVLFFKLMIEQRVREVGLLKAAGYPSRKIRAIFLWEGLILSGAGGLLGLLGSLVYGWFMVFGLRTFWIGAVGTRNLGLHISKLDLLIGIFAGVLCTFCAILWTLRDLQKNTPRLLLTGVFESHAVQFKRSRSLRIIVVLSFGAALLLAACSALGIISQLAGFFGSGFALLLFLLCSTALYLRKKRQFPVAGQGMPAFFRLGMRNVISRPARSLLCACLIASATFIILSMEAFRKDPQNTSLEKSSGTGGYPYIGESDLAIVHDLNSNAGREAAGIPATEFPELQNISFASFRERPGDDASCLNLYAPQNPRILGAPASFLAEARFSFQDSLDSTPQEKANPWLLLKSSPQASVIPAIADANTIQYNLHLSLGDEITVDGGKRGRIRLRLVAALKDSLLQGMLIISEDNFLRAFPEIEGRRFFLLDAPKPLSASGIRQLKERMVDWGFQVESSQERLAAFHRVENTYLTTFQSLGTLGLVLGVVGLAAILLRNVLERRKELALLRAIGYRKLILVWIILFESLALIVWGLAAGALSAFLAVLPALFSRGVAFPFMTTALILMAVLASGILSSLFAVIAVYRSPLLATLRSE